MTEMLPPSPDILTPRADGLYDISTASELLGVHPQTLRFYERRGLIEPSRSPGGQRRYSDEHLTQLANIQSLTGEGFNLAAISRIVEPEAEVQALKKALKARTPPDQTGVGAQGSNVSAENKEVPIP